MEKSMDMFIKPGLYRGFSFFWECNEWEADDINKFLRPSYTRTPSFPRMACTGVIGMI